MVQTRVRLLFGHCFCGVQVSDGKVVSTATPESFHRRCPGVLQSDDAKRALRCECECHQDLEVATAPDAVSSSRVATKPATSNVVAGTGSKARPGSKPAPSKTAGRARKQARRPATGAGAGRSPSPPS